MKEKYGPKFYSEIGKRGGETARNELGTAYYGTKDKKEKEIEDGNNDKINNEC